MSGSSKEKRPDEKVVILSRALSVVTVQNSLRADFDILRLCRRLELRPVHAGQRIGDCVTWKPARSMFFTLIKTECDTVIYCHHNDQIYITSVFLKLGHVNIPPYTGILCQWCEDKTEDGLEPRLLLFDVLPGRNTRAENVFQRGERLRSMEPSIPVPQCMLQWIGFKDPLVRTLLPNLPHEVEGLLVLCDDPLRPFFMPV